MLCKNCNFENDVTARFCENCGASLAGTEKLTYPTSYRALLGKRFVAALLDGLIVSGMLIPSMICLAIPAFAQQVPYDEYGAASGGGYSIFILFGMLLYIPALVYAFIKDGLGCGQSWGKRTVGLMVLHLSDGKPCTKGQSAIRALIGALLSATFIGVIIEPIMVLASDSGRRLADLAAGTQVIEKSILNA